MTEELNKKNPALVRVRGEDAAPTPTPDPGGDVAAWHDQRGRYNAGMVDDNGVSAMDNVNNAVRVNVVAGGGGAGANVTIVSPLGPQVMATSVAVTMATNQTPIDVDSATLAQEATLIAGFGAVIAALGALLTTAAFEARIPTNGQKTMAGSLPVVLASDQSGIPVTGGLTDAQLRASPVPVSGPLTDAQLAARVNVLGQTTMAQSTPVVIAQNQTTVSVKEVHPTGTVVSSVAASATNVTLLTANSGRLGATFYNDSSAILYLKCAATASTTSFTVQLLAGGYYELPFGYEGTVDGLWASATGSVRVTEFS